METSQKSGKKAKQPASAANNKGGSGEGGLPEQRKNNKPADAANYKRAEPRKDKAGDARKAGDLRKDKAAQEPARVQPTRATEDWIAEVSHELRLPIANIRLLVENVLDGALEEDPPMARRMLDRTMTEVERLQSLVVNLLSIEQVSAARRDQQCEWVLLEPRARYAAETVSKSATEKGVAVRIEIASGFKVYANPAQLDQVILNLVENAVKFTPAAGRVTIRSGSQNGSFAVEDTGVGMPAHEIPKIFQRFYRIDRAQSRGSTGLGLSIVKNIATMHGAKISVKSREGQGSSFSLEFPGPRGALSERAT